MYITVFAITGSDIDLPTCNRIWIFTDISLDTTHCNLMKLITILI